MISRKSIKDEKISHLQWCLDNLTLRENQNNIETLELLYRRIFNIIAKMNRLEEEEALVYYRNAIEFGTIKELLQEYNIELVV